MAAAHFCISTQSFVQSCNYQTDIGTPLLALQCCPQKGPYQRLISYLIQLSHLFQGQILRQQSVSLRWTGVCSLDQQSCTSLESNGNFRTVRWSLTWHGYTEISLMNLYKQCWKLAICFSNHKKYLLWSINKSGQRKGGIVSLFLEVPKNVGCHSPWKFLRILC